MFAGNCTFIISNGEYSCSYKIFKKRPLDGETKSIGVYQCYIRNSNKNIYCGYFKIKDKVLRFNHNGKYQIDRFDNRLTMLLDFIENRNIENTEYHLYHVGRCAHCGRMLTDSKSIERGFGPDCWKLIQC
jgi:hypothetical protein